MKRKYRVRENSPLYYAICTLGIIAWVVAMNLPLTIENLMGW